MWLSFDNLNVNLALNDGCVRNKNILFNPMLNEKLFYSIIILFNIYLIVVITLK